jgi:hypothetical protein
VSSPQRRQLILVQQSFRHDTTRQLTGCPVLLLSAVLPPVAMNVYPVAPVATAAAVAAVTHQWEAQKQHDEQHATEVLRDAVHQAIAAGVSTIPLHHQQHTYLAVMCSAPQHTVQHL